MAKTKKTLFISTIAIFYILIAYFLFINKQTRFNFNSEERVSNFTTEERERLINLIEGKPAVNPPDPGRNRNSNKTDPNPKKVEGVYIRDTLKGKPNVIPGVYSSTRVLKDSEMSLYKNTKIDSLLRATRLLLDTISKEKSKSDENTNTIVKVGEKIVGLGSSGTLVGFSYKGYKFSVNPDEKIIKKWFDKFGFNPNHTGKWSKTWAGRLGSKIMKRFMVFLMVSDIAWLIQEVAFPDFTLLQMLLTSVAIGMTLLILFMYLTKRGIFIE